ncbi:MAG: choice-of-anchor Q domain-containing protein [Polyangiales bacterium]
MKLGPLQGNGGSTMTHALGVGSVAINVIPADACVDHEGAALASDQRGFPSDS